MTETSRADGPLSMLPATALTMRSYDQEAAAYAAHTATYHAFPGLDQEVLAFHERAPAGPVLDAGCGAGRDTQYLSKLGRNVLALDVSAELLHTRPPGSDRDVRGRVLRVQGDLVSLPVLDSQLAGIWMCASLLHLPRALHLSVLRQARDTLRPGGALAVSMQAGDGDEVRTDGSVAGPRWRAEVEPGEFAAQLRQAGLRDVSVDWSGRGAWYVATGTRD